MSGTPLVLDAIVGEQLSSVEFVQDYVQLHFDGPSIIAYVWPVVEVGGKAYRFGDSSYRDVLCGWIAHRIPTAFVVEEEELKIEFDDGAALSISLRPEDRTGPEAADYIPRRGGPILDF
ncbi:MAG TPA: hypothetical protein VLB32_05565 [Candidatus Acidoferrales bacterium]|nr:hypothetical protein [Candidatus Acidoferrales bacterium]